MDRQIPGAVPPSALANARVELHWLAQVLGAVGDAFLERAPDDGQSNVEWDDRHSALIGRPIGAGARVGLDIAKAQLLVIGASGSVSDRAAARGKRLPELLAWAGDAISAASGTTPAMTPKNRDYDMPQHPVSSGEPFAFASEAALTELARWFAGATVWLNEARGLDSRSSDVRCWPHHFDIGGIIILEPDKPFEEARQMGFGWSPGDGSYDQPYFYITPFPVPDSLPALASGHWHREGFTGAILTGTDVVDSSSQGELVQTFLRSTIERALPLITP